MNNAAMPNDWEQVPICELLEPGQLKKLSQIVRNSSPSELQPALKAWFTEPAMAAQLAKKQCDPVFISYALAFALNVDKKGENN